MFSLNPLTVMKKTLEQKKINFQEVQPKKVTVKNIPIVSLETWRYNIKHIIPPCSKKNYLINISS